MRRRDELAWRAAHRINERTKTMNLIVQHTVRDYDAWKPVFDEHQSVRAKYGCRGHTIYRDADKPNDVTIVMDYESRERADEFMRDPSLAAAMAVSYTHLRAHETRHDLVCRLLLEKKKTP